MRPAHGGNAMYGLPWPLLHVQRMLSQMMPSGMRAVRDAGAAHPTRGAGTRVFRVLSGRGTCPNVQKVTIRRSRQNETAQYNLQATTDDRDSRADTRSFFLLTR